MDTSYWIKLNPKISVSRTPKRWFGKYYCRMVIFCPAGRILLEHLDDINDALQTRIAQKKTYNYGGSWFQHRNKNIEGAEVGQLEIIRGITRDYPNVKMRVEEPWIQFYGETEEDLKIIASRFSSEHTSRLMSVQAPDSVENFELLKNGVTLISPTSKIEYRYKVIFRDAMYPLEVKHQILNYLENCGDDVKISKGTVNMLKKESTYIWGAFIYVNDLKIQTFLSIICPTLVLKITELVKSS